PLGRTSLVVNLGMGKPLAATVKEPPEPTVNVRALAVVNAGASLTVKVKPCVVAAPTPLLAVEVRGEGPPLPAAGGPPGAAGLGRGRGGRVAARGGARLARSGGGGRPEAVSASAPAVPTVKLARAALVRAGASLAVRANV